MRSSSLSPLPRSTAALAAAALLTLTAAPALAQGGAAGQEAAESKSEWEGFNEEQAPPEYESGETQAEPGEAETTAPPPTQEWSATDVEEIPGRTYFFVGGRYRGNVIPAFMLDMFLEGGETIYTNMVGLEFDIRKDGFSLIPAISYHELGTGDILFKQKNKADIAGNYAIVNSGMKVVYATVDLLWSAKLSKNVEFEYGAGFGLGAVFGDLENTWVHEDANGPLRAANGKRFSRCEAVLAAGTGCNRADHQNADVDKVNGYKEPSWFDGGSKPVVFPWIAAPQLGLRIKPVKNFVGRVGVGFALTGFWFGLSAQYGLEQKRD